MFPTVPTDIQIPIATSNLNYICNFTKKTILKIEAQLSALKNYVDCKFSTLQKLMHFQIPSKNAIKNLQKRESNYTNTDLLHQNITSLKKELKSKDKIIQSLLQTQNAFSSLLSNLKTKQPELIVNLNQQRQRQHQKYHHYHHHHHHQQQQQQHQNYHQQQSQTQRASQQPQKIRAAANKYSKV